MSLKSKILSAAMLFLGLVLLPEFADAQGKIFHLPNGGKQVIERLNFISQTQKTNVDTLTGDRDTCTTNTVDVAGASSVVLFHKYDWSATTGTLLLPDTVFVFAAFSPDDTTFTAWTPLDTVLVNSTPQPGILPVPVNADTTSWRPMQVWPPQMVPSQIDTVATTVLPAAVAGVIPKAGIAANNLNRDGYFVPGYRSVKFLFRQNDTDNADRAQVQAKAAIVYDP